MLTLPLQPMPDCIHLTDRRGINNRRPRIVLRTAGSYPTNCLPSLSHGEAPASMIYVINSTLY